MQVLTRAARDNDGYRRTLDKLSRASVRKHFDAYADIPWDAPEMQLDRSDPRLELHRIVDDSLTHTEWYRRLDTETRAALGLYTVANFAKIGIQFESILQRGLLEYAERLPNGAAEFRYVYHEVIEEGQHSLMFQEFINRSGLDVAGMPAWTLHMGRQVIHSARPFPELFFLFVLGGEEPIDYVQRQALEKRDQLHPLVRRISQIHVTEEARHISFARAYLRERVPRLSAQRRAILAHSAPMIFGVMAPMMLCPSTDAVATFEIPRDAWRQAYGKNAFFAGRLAAATAKVRALCSELGLMTPVSRELWKRLRMNRDGARVMARAA